MLDERGPRTREGARVSFTLDLARREFERLPTVGHEELITLAHRYLMTFPPIDLDSEE